ncbi:prolyl oligopeptidase family serine peptidase, partial [Psychrobacter sp. GW64-MNA-CIBAN-0177]
LGHKQLAKVEELWLKSNHDQLPIQAWVAYPPGFDSNKKYPLILEIHGGPVANYGPHFSAEVQLYAAKGNVVLYMNPRGSDSYGKEFAQTIHHNYPSNDYDDLMTGV